MCVFELVKVSGAMVIALYYRRRATNLSHPTSIGITAVTAIPPTALSRTLYGSSRNER